MILRFLTKHPHTEDNNKKKETEFMQMQHTHWTRSMEHPFEERHRLLHLFISSSIMPIATT